MRSVGRAVATAILAGLVGAVWAALFYAWHPSLIVDFDRDLPTQVTGIYTPERDRASGLTFAWTSADAVLRLPGLDRRAGWTLDLRFRGGRPNSAENPDVTILADGAVLAMQPSTRDFSDMRVAIPPRPERRGLVVTIQCSKTFVPGASDPRALGVMLDRLALTPDGIVLVPDSAMLAASLSSAAMGAAIALVGVTPGSAIGAAVLLSAGDAAVVARGFAPYSDYPGTVVRLGYGVAIGLAIAALAIQAWRKGPLRNTARFAAAFSASALFLKLLVLLHPNMPVGDAMFHAHRFQGVLAGKLLFTSIAPGGYAFPYPPGLYVFAAPFAGLGRRGASDMALLRIVTCAVDAAAGLLLYWIVARAWGNRLAGAMSVAIYHLIPLNFAVLATGNLTNAFAQSVALASLAIMAAPSLTFGAWTPTAALAGVLAAAFMSHTSTFAIVFTAAVLVAALFALRGGTALRRASLAIALAVLAAAVLSIVLYYAHFMDTYRAEFARIGRETTAAAPDVGGRTIGDRLRLVPYSLGVYIGVPVLLFSLVGGVKLALASFADRLTLCLAGWIGSCLAFLVLGILTPIDMRYYLAALPALAIAAGYGAAWAWNEGWPRHSLLWRLTTAAFLAGTISTGFHNWWNALG
jgi:hypothetical protein